VSQDRINFYDINLYHTIKMDISVIGKYNSKKFYKEHKEQIQWAAIVAIIFFVVIIVLLWIVVYYPPKFLISLTS